MQVRTDRLGRPRQVEAGQRRHRITELHDTWQIDDEWWRTPISRRYYRVVLDNGDCRTLYHDLLADTWHEQGY